MSKIFNVIRAEDIDCINGMSPYIQVGKSVILLKVINSLIEVERYNDIVGDYKSITIRYNTSSYDQFDIEPEAYKKLNDIVQHWFRYRQVHPDYIPSRFEEFAKDIPFANQDNCKVEPKSCVLGFKECPLKPVKRKIVNFFNNIFGFNK